MNHLRKRNKGTRYQKLVVNKITVVFFGIFVVFTIVGSSIYSVRAQIPINPQNQDDARSREDIGSRHVVNYRTIPTTAALWALRGLFPSEDGTLSGYFKNRMQETIAPEMIDYYKIFSTIEILNMPDDMRQQYLLDMQNNISGQQNQNGPYLSNVEDCDDPWDFLTNCVRGGIQAQDQIIQSTIQSQLITTENAIMQELEAGGGSWGVYGKTDFIDIDGESQLPGFVISSGNMMLNTLQSLLAYVALLQAQHGVPGDVGSDPAQSLASIQSPDSENIENPSHGPIDNNPQLPDDFGTGDSDPFDDWSFFDSNPWMDSTRNQMQQTINDFGDIGAPDDEGRALTCLPLQRLANVADILGTERTQELMRADTQNINCLPNKPGNTSPSVHEQCTPERTIQSVTDTALILGLPNKHYGVSRWNVYLWPEGESRETDLVQFTNGAFGGSCVWVVSADDGTGASAAFIGNDRTGGFVRSLRDETE